MEFEFDKEMDSLLRQTAKSDILFPKQTANAEHIDADEISMFAENALPEKAKPRVTKHLANCDRCRTVLSNVIVLNAEDEKVAAVPVTTTQVETAVASTEPGWFQKLFATKNLAFGMGALALVFAVGIGFIVVQNISNSGSELAKRSSSESMSTADNSTDITKQAESPLPQQDDLNANSASADSELQESDAKEDVTQNEVLDSDISTDNVKTKNKATKQNKESLADDSFGEDSAISNREDKASRKIGESISDKRVVTESTVQEESDSEKKDESAKLRDQDNKPKTASPPPPPKSKPVTTRNKGVRRKKSANEDIQAESKVASGLAIRQRTIKGKTFTQKNGVWTDSAYKNQSTTNVKRGTTQYRNLDKSLQSIGNQLNGTVIVLWKSKAYKIQ